MNRREFLFLAVGTAGIAGCSESTGEGSTADNDETEETGTTDGPPGTAEECSIAQSTKGVETTRITVDGTFEGAKAVGGLRWNARAQQSIKDEPDDFIGSEANPGNKYIIFRLAVTNTSEDIVTVDAFNFELDYETPDAVDTVSSAINGIDEIDANIKPSGTVSGLLTFIVPSEATTATLRAREPNFADRIPLAFDPECDSALPMNAPTLDNDEA